MLVRLELNWIKKKCQTVQLLKGRRETEIEEVELFTFPIRMWIIDWLGQEMR